MLQPAATSANSSLALAAGTPVGTAENLEIPEGFAALLALGMAAGAESEAELAAAPEGIAAALRQGGKASGNASGNILPLLLPEAKATAAAPQPDCEILPENRHTPTTIRQFAPRPPRNRCLPSLPWRFPCRTISLRVPQVEVADPEQPDRAPDAAGTDRANNSGYAACNDDRSARRHFGSGDRTARRRLRRDPAVAKRSGSADGGNTESGLRRCRSSQGKAQPAAQRPRAAAEPKEASAEPVRAAAPTINRCQGSADLRAATGHGGGTASVNLPASSEAAQPGKVEARAWRSRSCEHASGRGFREPPSFR